MPLLNCKMRVLVGLLGFGLSGSLWAAHTPNHVDINKSPELQRVTRITQQLERSKIIEDTQNTFSLLGAEIALERGQPELALNTYLAVLKKTKDPEVAERAMELAVSLRQYQLAEEIYALWQDIQPDASPAQRRISWARALASGNAPEVFEQLDAILSEAEEGQVRRIFLMLSQVSLHNSEMVRTGGKHIHKLAWQYADMPEAMIAETIYSAGNQETKHTIAALKKLSEIDTELSYVTRMTLGVLVREQPNILFKFFDKHDSRDLPSMWQELEIENLIQAKKYGEAQKRLKKLLDNNPNTNLYFLAASQAYQHNKNAPEALIYLEKAHQHGTPQQKGRAATMLAIHFLSDNRWEEAEKWIARIQAAEFAFDKNVLEMSLAAERKQWNQVIKLYNDNRELAPNIQHHIFEEAQREQFYVFALAETRAPQAVLSELNRMLKAAEKNSDNQRIGVLLYQRGILYSDKLNRLNDAIVDLRRYLALNPESAAAQNSLGYTLLSLPEFVNEGAELISKAYQKDPENTAINDSMGWAYFMKGDYATAKIYLEFAYKNEPSAEVAAHLGETYWLMGEQDKARTVWQEGLKLDKNDRVLNQTLLKYNVKF